MQLKSTEAWNFGIHRHIKLEFRNGFVVVTGKNKKGKSTAVIQATLYGLFGAGMLEAPLADTVTTGEKESRLKVEVHIGEYTITRSKSTAMVTGPNGVKISGQVNVSEFIREELGIKTGAESRIMAAEQNLVTGVLAGKPGEVNKFIESVAGFSKIDDIILRVKEVFPYGSKKVYEEFLTEAEGQLKELGLRAIEDPSYYERELNIVRQESEKITEALTTVRRELSGLRDDLEQAREEERRVKSLKEKILWQKKLQTDIQEELTQLATRLAALPTFKKDAVENARELVTLWPSMLKRKEAKDWVEAQPVADVQWEGDFESLTAEANKIHSRKTKLEDAIAVLEADIRSHMAQVVSGENMVCRTCGTDLTSRYEEVNKKLRDQAAEKETELAELRKKLPAIEEEFNTLKKLISTQNNLMVEASRFDPDLLAFDKSVVPFTVTYTGPAADTVLDEDTYLKCVELLREYDAVENQREELNTRIANKKERLNNIDISSLEEALTNRPNIKPSAELLDSIAAKIETEKSLSARIAELGLEEAGLDRKIDAVIQEIENIKKEKADTRAKIRRLKESIKKDERNKKLVSNVVAAKVKVLDRVWSNILVYVSSQYSSIMGDQVEVTKTEQGFRVNNKPFKRLSGSERTVLGVSLRAALRAVFAERCECMLWDEPLDGADRDTAAAIIAAIKSIPGQNIMITHDTDSVGVCDQQITIGEQN
jgi:DNA repair exonuclease SbcCD ATPase subunit